MTPEETKKCIEVMQGYVDGKGLEYKWRSQDIWQTLIGVPLWNWHDLDYRIKLQQVSIPATEEEISYIESVPKLIVKSKWSNEIYVLPKEHEQYKKECLIYNPDTKCWEDWGNEK